MDGQTDVHHIPRRPARATSLGHARTLTFAVAPVVWSCGLAKWCKRIGLSALLQKRHELIHGEQELADVAVQHRLPQRVSGMRFAELDGVRFTCGIEEHPRRTPPRLSRAIAEPVENAEKTPPRELVGQPGHSLNSRTLDWHKQSDCHDGVVVAGRRAGCSRAFSVPYGMLRQELTLPAAFASLPGSESRCLRRARQSDQPF